MFAFLGPLFQINCKACYKLMCVHAIYQMYKTLLLHEMINPKDLYWGSCRVTGGRVLASNQSHPECNVIATECKVNGTECYGC